MEKKKSTFRRSFSAFNNIQYAKHDGMMMLLTKSFEFACEICVSNSIVLRARARTNIHCVNVVHCHSLYNNWTESFAISIIFRRGAHNIYADFSFSIISQPAYKCIKYFNCFRRYLVSLNVYRAESVFRFGFAPASNCFRCLRANLFAKQLAPKKSCAATLSPVSFKNKLCRWQNAIVVVISQFLACQV